MSEPTGARRYGTGGGDAYYDAVKYGGYEGTREQFGKDQAEFATNATAVAAAKKVVEQDTEEVRSTKETFVNTTVPEAITAIQQEGTTQVQAVTQQGEKSSQQVEAVGTQWKDEVANEGRARVQAVEQAGTNQVQAVNDAGTTQVGAVNQAGADQVDAVEQAGTGQVQAVTDEGTTQVTAVEDAGAAERTAIEEKGEQTRESIPDDYTALSDEVDNLNRQISDVEDALNDAVPCIKQVNPAYEQGTLDDDGQPSAASNRYRTVDFVSITKGYSHYITIGTYGTTIIRAYIYQYDGEKNYIKGKAIGWLNVAGVQKVNLEDDCAYIKIIVSRSNNTSLTEYDCKTISIIEVNELSQSETLPTFSVKYGTIKDGTNIFVPTFTNTRANSNFIPAFGNTVKVTIPDGYKAYIWQFDSTFNFIREDGWVFGSWLKGIEKESKYIVITYADVSNTSVEVNLDTLLDTTVEFVDVNKFNPNSLLCNSLLWSHRGAESAPENTLPAIELAIEQGFKAIEIDLEFTSDNVCVLLHDTTINRTSNGTGNIYDMTYAQALAYDFGSWKSADYAGTKIPTLEEALLLCKRHGVVVQLDIASTTKTNISIDNIIEMCEVIKKTGMVRNVTVCAYHERLRQVLSALPGVCITFGMQYLAATKFDDLAWLSSLATYSAQTTMITSANIVHFHDLGFVVQTWEVDTTTDYDNYFNNYYVDWIITNSLLPSDVT